MKSYYALFSRVGRASPAPLFQMIARSLPTAHAARLWRVVLGAAGVAVLATALRAQPSSPIVHDPNLAVRTVVFGLTTPITMAFLHPNDFLVTEKSTGRVKRVVDGVVTATVLDLAVNSAADRGLLGIALHPNFNRNKWVYLFWTESSTGADTTVMADVGRPASPFPPGTPSPFGHRVDRFIWDGDHQTLTFDRNIIVLRAYQADGTQPLNGQNNGGVLRFEHASDAKKAKHDQAKLFIIVGDVGRRGMLQNLLQGPTGPNAPDDQFGGPEPDNAHLAGVVLRVNDDGTAPSDNPFYAHGAAVGGQEGANLQKIFAYGLRNSFGLAVDPVSGELWNSENGDDSFDEINRVEPGHNGGWIQARGPLARLSEFKTIETTPPFTGLRQDRWPATNIADSPIVARARMVDLPGSHYAEPQFSWKWSVTVAGLGFLEDDSLGSEYQGDLFVGSALPILERGFLMRFKPTPNRQRLTWSDPRLADQVADNPQKYNITESETLLFGSNFGISSDIHTGPNGNLFIVSISKGAVFEIYRLKPDKK
jgi:aldose sugar dehydrogenase